jgi:hypothetical protein
VASACSRFSNRTQAHKPWSADRASRDAHSCLREIRATVDQQKPWVLVHEVDRGHGGLPLEEAKDECPEELRSIIFTHTQYHEDQDGHLQALERNAPKRQVVKWMRIKDFQLLSLRLICSAILHSTPYYQNLAAEGGSFPLLEDSRRKKAERKMRVSPFKSGRSSEESIEDDDFADMSERTQRTQFKHTGEEFAELKGMYVPGEVTSLNLSCEHLAHPAKLIHSSRNPGAYAFGKELVRAIGGITLVAEPVSGLRTRLKDADEYVPGERVTHIKHGLGSVTGYLLEDGRMEVAFDVGETHHYNVSSIGLKIHRAPSDAPRPPEWAVQRMSADDLTAHRPSSSAKAPTGGSKPRHHRPSMLHHGTKSRRSSSFKSSRGVKPGELELLLLYLNRDTWIGQDGIELEEIVRAAWYAAGHMYMSMHRLRRNRAHEWPGRT